jgi:predicted nucleotidyltransferase/uncharacterized protein (UPF0332 family)
MARKVSKSKKRPKRNNIHKKKSKIMRKIKKKPNKKNNIHKKESKKIEKLPQKIPTLDLVFNKDIAMDFATKVYKKFGKSIKSIILFGSTAKKTNVHGSDVDVIIILDDASIIWDHELIAWYREELDLILRRNPYKKPIHINTVKLTTWWQDLLRGDPVIINILRHGEAMIDMAGFFNPLKFLLIQGKIKSTPEAIYSSLQRAPTHILRSKLSELNSIEGLYWAMVDSAHAALIAQGVSPPSPEHIPHYLKELFVDSKKLKAKYVEWYRDLLTLHKKIAHGEIKDLKGVEIDNWQEKTQGFLDIMVALVDRIISES